MTILLLCPGFQLTQGTTWIIIYRTLLFTPTPCPSFRLHTNVIIVIIIDFLEPTAWMCVAHHPRLNEGLKQSSIVAIPPKLE